MTVTTPAPAAASLAARAYGALGAAFGQAPGADTAAEAARPDLAGLARSFADTLREGERTALSGLAGKADAQSVVTALAASEIAIQTAVTLRDKVVEAYNEILRMPV